MRCDFSTRILVFQYVGLSRACLGGRNGFWWCQIALFPLPLTIWLSLVPAGLTLSDCGFSLLQACVSVFLEDQFSLGKICLWRAVVQGQLWAQTEPGWILPLAVTWFLCHDGSVWVPLGSVFWAEMVVLPMFTGILALLGVKLSSSHFWMRSAVAQDQLQGLSYRRSFWHRWNPKGTSPCFPVLYCLLGSFLKMLSSNEEKQGERPSWDV